MMQMHQLEGFYRVAKAGGYARAAREFPYPISAPGVHAQVRKLESSLGVRLFEQVAKDQLVPTRSGQQLLEFCAPFFARLPQVAGSIARGDTRGLLRLEAGALEIQEVLPAWVRRVHARLPDVEIELREISVADHSRLLRGEVDMIIDYQPQVPRGVSARPVALHRGFFVAPADRARAKPKLEDFKHEPFVALDPAQPQHRVQIDALRMLGAEPQRITYVPSVTSVLAFVAAGLGYSLVPWPSLRGPRVAGVSAVGLRGKGTRFPVLASWRTRTEPDPVLDAVLKLARA